MMIVGLTGGIGSGKTTVAQMFKDLGVPVYNSDKQAKKLMRSSKKVRKNIIALLGKKAYRDKELNRAYIANQVFADKELLDKLNAIVHPAVRKHFEKWVQKQDSPYVVQEVAIIFESHNQEFYDKIILVTAPTKVRLNRILKRDKISAKEVIERMANQLPDDKKTPLSDFVIENVHIEKTKVRINEIHELLLEYS